MFHLHTLLLPIVFIRKTMHFSFHHSLLCLLWVTCLLELMLNGPCWCNRFNYCMRFPNWILKRQLIHKLSEKYFCKKEKSMYVIYIQTETLSAICSISKWTNLLRCFKLKLNLHVKPFSNCAPPHRDLTCTIIQGGMDSNRPLSEVAQALKQRGQSWAQNEKPK